jgi:poly(hydroxyalkanoate) depolymerase family esterase
MDKGILAGIAQALQLTKAGRLGEATRLIQESLTRRRQPDRFDEPAPQNGDAVDDIIEGQWAEVTPPTVAVSAIETVQAELRPEPRADDAPPRTAPPVTRQPSEWIAGDFENAAGHRAYKLYVPSRSPGQSLPLIVMLHGCQQSPDDFAAGTQMNIRAEEHGCLVLYPAQSNSANPSRCWNWFRREDQVREAGEPSLIADMTRDVVRRYGVDPLKVFVAGLSAGGAMAAVMAVNYPDLYAAVGIHSGLACGSAHDLPSALAAMRGLSVSMGQRGNSSPPVHATPTIVFHGDHDRTVHPRNGIDAIANSAHWEGGQGGAVVTEQGQAPGGHAFTRTVHRDAAGQLRLEHWLVHGGGHAWFGGSRAGSYSDPRGPDASAEMMRFFLQRT